ncbi:MAG: DNA topoisomerase, partial [Prevotella sp.]
DMERQVYDLIARRFIAAFYPDCKFSTTTVMGTVVQEDGKPDTSGELDFKVTGKEILSPGWRAVYAKEGDDAEEDNAKENSADNSNEGAKGNKDEQAVLPHFTVGENGPHKPTLTEKQTQPPKHYTEASLLRAMETAGKFVDDEELRAAMKENGIGRPSSRASIIETLFKRHYIKRERKNVVSTPIGQQLIETIHDKLLTSVELTGIWEKKLRDIEHHKYDAAQFINELKQQIIDIVNEVMHDV